MSTDDSNTSFTDQNACKQNKSKTKQQKKFNFEIDISEKNIFRVQRVQSGKKTRNKITNTYDWSHKLNDETCFEKIARGHLNARKLIPMVRLL